MENGTSAMKQLKQVRRARCRRSWRRSRGRLCSDGPGGQRSQRSSCLPRSFVARSCPRKRRHQSQSCQRRAPWWRPTKQTPGSESKTGCAALRSRPAVGAHRLGHVAACMAQPSRERECQEQDIWTRRQAAAQAGYELSHGGVVTNLQCMRGTPALRLDTGSRRCSRHSCPPLRPRPRCPPRPRTRRVPRVLRDVGPDNNAMLARQVRHSRCGGLVETRHGCGV